MDLRQKLQQHLAGNMAKTVLITGASSGIGREFARIFAAHGYNLVLVARGRGKLQELADEFSEQHKVAVKMVAKDLSGHSSPRELFDELKKDGVQVDVLVNNAGFATYGFFKDTDLASELQEMQLNMVALTHLTKLFLPGMLAKGAGKILNVASTAAFQPGPLMAVYYATKAYVLSFSEALANELEGTGLTVTALCPGPTRTGFSERAEMGQSRLFRGRIMDARQVARVGYNALMKGKTVVIPGFKNRLFAFAVRLLPRKLVADFVRRIQGEM